MNIAEYRKLQHRYATLHKSLESVYQKPDCLSEYTECVDLAYKLDQLKDEGKVIEYTHISNETFTKSWNTKRKNKAQGVKKGVPDYLIILKDKVVFIEMKRTKGGTVSLEQKQWIAAINAAGGYATVAKGATAAINYLETLL